jgi:hypothetical protein
VLQDLKWEESVAAAKTSVLHTDIEAYREAIIDSAFAQPSYGTRFRYAKDFIKWFLPTVSLNDLVPTAWKAFQDETVLRQVMRWQYVTSIPLVSGFVDGPLSAVPPGQPVDDVVDTYLLQSTGNINEKTRQRIRANLTKIGLLIHSRKAHYRIVPEVSPQAVTLLLAYLFAREPQAISWATLVADPWWKRLGIVDEAMLREKLQEAVTAKQLARVRKVDTLDQVTTRYSLNDLKSGKARRR